MPYSTAGGFAPLPSFAMTPEEAKFILAAIPPEPPPGAARNPMADPETDPEVAEALRLLDRDSALREWYERSRAFDGLVAERLREIETPPGLEASLLAGLRLSTPPRRQRARPYLVLLAGAGLAAAAAVALALVPWLRSGGSAPVDAPGLAATGTGIPATATLEEFRSEVLGILAELQGLPHLSGDPLEVAAWLADRGAPFEGEIPAVAGEHRLAGCAVLEWRGHRLSLVCFHLPGEEGPPGLHLVTIDAQALRPFQSREGTAAFDERTGPWTTAAWQSEGKVQLAIAKGSRPDLHRLIPLG